MGKLKKEVRSDFITLKIIQKETKEKIRDQKKSGVESNGKPKSEKRRGTKWWVKG